MRKILHSQAKRFGRELHKRLELLLKPTKIMQQVPRPTLALKWVRAHEVRGGGIRVHSAHPNAYPEVSGYFVPTLLRFGEQEMAARLTRWLVSIQLPCGAYADPDHGKPYVFDTGQVLRGLLAGIDLAPGSADAAKRAADYLCAQMIQGGGAGFGSHYAGTIPESVLLYVIPPLVQAGRVFQEPEYLAAAERCIEHYSARKDSLQIDNLTHFLGYELEALIELGRMGTAAPVLEALRKEQTADGSVRGRGRTSWVCCPGLAQLAVCWYKVGQWEPADMALARLEEHQMPSGGFLGSYGPGANYFPQVEVSWAVKYYLDAHRLRVLSFMERNAHSFPGEVSISDGRAQAILKVIRPGDKVLEVGCGKGRFLKIVRQRCPDSQCTGIDISSMLLAEVPAEIQCLRGSLESVPCSENSFDVVFSVEVIGHSANLEWAVAEMIRVTRPGGWVVVIDKQRSHWGRFVTPPWEFWPDAERLKQLLMHGCNDVTYEPVSYDDHPADGLMLVWRGRKRST